MLTDVAVLSRIIHSRFPSARGLHAWQEISSRTRVLLLSSIHARKQGMLVHSVHEVALAMNSKGGGGGGGRIRMKMR